MTVGDVVEKNGRRYLVLWTDGTFVRVQSLDCYYGGDWFTTTVHALTV